MGFRGSRVQIPPSRLGKDQSHTSCRLGLFFERELEPSKEFLMAREPLHAFQFQGAAGGSPGAGIVVICDDGAFYAWEWAQMSWTQLPPVPGTLTDRRARRWHVRPVDFAAIDDGRARRHLIRERPDQVQR